MFRILLFGFWLGTVTQSTEARKTELFDVFWRRFNQNLIYQKSNIQFPLLVIHSPETTADRKAKRFYMTASEWEYINLIKRKDRKDTISIQRKSKDLYVVVLEHENTGIYIVYKFVQSKAGWRLVQINDEST